MKAFASGLLLQAALAAALCLTATPRASASRDPGTEIAAPNSIPAASIGFAAFRRQGFGVAVFARPLQVDLRQLRSQPGFAAAKLTLLPDATIITIPLGQAHRLRILPHPASWSLAIEPEPRQTPAVTPSFDTDEVRIPLPGHGPALTIPDPASPGTLLVGTGTGSGGLSAETSGPDYTILPCWQGVLVQARSGGLVLSPDPGGFLLNAAHPGKGEAGPAVTAGAADLPEASVAALNGRRLNDQLALATAPPEARFPPSIRLAKDLLALGMGPEAAGVLRNTHDDALSNAQKSLRDDLLAIAEIESDRPSPDFSELVTGRAGPSEQARFWYGIDLAESGRDAEAGTFLKDSFAVLQDDAPPLQDLAAPVAADALLGAGEVASAQALINMLPDVAQLGLERAEILKIEGHPKDALDAYERLQQSGDIRTAGIAAMRAILLRHRMGQIGAREAARDLSRNLYLWRGTRESPIFRIELAKLFADAAEWPQALRTIEDGMTILPQSLPELHAEHDDLCRHLLNGGTFKAMPPLELVTVLQDCRGLIPPGPEGEPFLHSLAEGFLGLDLPDMAAPVQKEIEARRSAAPPASAPPAEALPASARPQAKPPERSVSRAAPGKRSDTIHAAASIRSHPSLALADALQQISAIEHPGRPRAIQ